MTTNTNGRLRSALGEHLIALLLVAMVIVGSLAALPSVMTQTASTATQVEDRMNVPFTVAAELDSAP